MVVAILYQTISVVVLKLFYMLENDFPLKVGLQCSFFNNMRRIEILLTPVLFQFRHV